MMRRTAEHRGMRDRTPLTLGADGESAKEESFTSLLPVLTLTGAVGLFVVALADDRARSGGGGGLALYWIGLAVLVLPIAVRQLSASPARGERLGLTVVLGAGLYLVKVLHSPIGFTFADEFAHWRTAMDIQQTGRLFERENPLLIVSPLYPGLEVLATAITDLTGWSVFVSGLLVLGLARLVFVLSLFLFLEHASGSEQIAGIAVLIYVANPSFLYFDAQFSYESLALPFAALTLFALARSGRPGCRSTGGFRAVGLVGLAATVVTHHMTSYMLTGFLVLWTMAALLLGRRTGAQSPPVWIAGIGAAASVGWLVLVGTPTLQYLVPVLSGGVEQLIGLIRDEQESRQLFQNSAGEVAPLWERAMGFASVCSILATLPRALVLVWRDQRANSLAVALAAAAAAYPATLALRLTHLGAETANRTSGFLFLGIGFVLASGAVRLRRPQHRGRVRLVLLATWYAVVWFGGMIVGVPDWARVPGPYIAAADMRSVDGEGIAAADWMRRELGPGNRIAADRTNRFLLATYGDQRAVTFYVDGANVPAVILASSFGPVEQEALQIGRISYVVVDRRLSTTLPLADVYVELGEPRSDPTRPVSLAALTKFDDVYRASRVFDSGDICIYDVSGVSPT